MKRSLIIAGSFLLVLMFAFSLTYAASSFEGFEGGKGSWIFPDKTWEGNNTTGIEASKEYASEGKSSLKINFAGEGFRAIGFVEGEWNMESVSAISLDLYNGTEDGQLAIAVCTGDAWFWWEASPVTVKGGWNKGITFDMSATTWKSAATGWNFSAKPKGLKSVKRFVVLFFEGTNKNGSVYVDNIQLAGVAGEEKETVEVQAPKVSANGSVSVEYGNIKDDGYLKSNYYLNTVDKPGSYTRIVPEITVKTNEGAEVYLKTVLTDGYTSTVDNSNIPPAYLDTGHITYDGLRIFYHEKFRGSNELGDPFKLYYCEQKIKSEDIPYDYGMSYNKSFGNLNLDLLYLPTGKTYYDKGYKEPDPHSLTGGRVTYSFDGPSLGFTFSNGYASHWDFQDSNWTQKPFTNTIYAVDLTYPTPISNLGTIKIGYAYDAADTVSQQIDNQQLEENTDNDAIVLVLQGVNFGGFWFYFEFGDFGRGFYNNGGEWAMHNSKKTYGNVFWKPIDNLSLKLAYDGFTDKDWAWTGQANDYGKWTENWVILTAQATLMPFTITAEYAVDEEDCTVNSKKPSQERVGASIDYSGDVFFAKVKFDQLKPTSDTGGWHTNTNQELQLGFNINKTSKIGLTYGHYEFCLFGKTGIIDSFLWDNNTESIKLTYTNTLSNVMALKVAYEEEKQLTDDKDHDELGSETIYSVAIKYNF